MKQEEIIKEIDEKLEELYKKLTERIAELHGLAGTHQHQFLQGSRHTFCYYRDFVFEAQMLLRDLKVK